MADGYPSTRAIASPCVTEPFVCRCYRQPNEGERTVCEKARLRLVQVDVDGEGRMFDCTILLVDDEKAYSEVVGEALRSYGFNVHTANNAFEASKLLDIVEPDLVFADHRMPLIDGVSFLKQMRANPKWARTPIIMASADPPRAGSGADSAVSGPISYLRKPFTIDTLRSSVHEILLSV